MTTVVLTATADVVLRGNAAEQTTNWGAENNYVGEAVGFTGYIRRTLVKFDLSSIPSNAIIDSATFSMYCVTDGSNNARTFRIYRQLRDWVEMEATWIIWKTGSSWSTAGGFSASDCEATETANRSMTSTETLNEYKLWTMSVSKIQSMIDGSFTNNGFLIKADTESDDGYSFESREDANPPKLEITYHLIPKNSVSWWI